MKQHFWKRLTCVLCAAMMLWMPLHVHAQEEAAETEFTFPSGKTLSQIVQEMESTNANEHKGDSEDTFASAEVGIFRGDEILYTGYFGEVNAADHVPADETCVYEWGSISKTLIWVSVMQLYEQGKIDLERDVREYLPEGFFRHLSYDNPITMLHLMNHNAGWQETTRPIEIAREEDVLPLKESLQSIEPAQVFRPGDVTAYSNYGAGVAGYVVECITGQDFCEYVHEHIFEPLGMEHTALNPTHSDNDYVYQKRPQMHSYGTAIGNQVDLGACLEYIPAYPAGAATGTLADLMTYAQAFVNDDAPLFEHPETQELLLSGTSFYGESDIPTSCHGFWAEERAVRLYGHSGATIFGQADMVFDPESGIGLVILINEYGGNWYIENVPALVFGHTTAEHYLTEPAQEIDTSGFFVMSRSVHHGMMKFMGALNGFDLKTMAGIDKATDIGQNVCAVYSDDHTMLVGKNTYENGNWGLEQPSNELMHDSGYVFKLLLLTVYMLAAVTTIFLLRIRFRLHREKVDATLVGSKLLAAGQTARLVSLALLLTSYVYYAQNMGGVPEGAAKCIGIGQMICAAVCVVSAIAAAAELFRHKELWRRILNGLHILCSVCIVTAVLYFEMYQFWGC